MQLFEWNQKAKSGRQLNAFNWQRGSRSAIKSLYFCVIVLVVCYEICFRQRIRITVKTSVDNISILIHRKERVLDIGTNTNYKFIITVATHQRANNRTSYYVQRAVRSIIAQKYDKWELFATGDKYVDEMEFSRIFRHIPANKLFTYNLRTPGERHNLSGFRLWLCAGATAMNNALDRAEEKYVKNKQYQQDILIITHIDDDDTWHPDHLQNFALIYKRFPTVHFVWSKGYHCASKEGAIIFPVTNLSDTIDNMPPTLGKTLHSTVSWKMKSFRSFRYRRDWEYKNEPPMVADGDMWQRMNKFMKINNYSFYHSSIVTVEHLEEMGHKSCSKKDGLPVWYPDE